MRLSKKKIDKFKKCKYQTRKVKKKINHKLNKPFKNSLKKKKTKNIKLQTLKKLNYF